MAIKESGEMYLETILVLSKRMDMVRAIDVGEELGYSKPSVSRAIHLLKDRGYLDVQGDGAIVLTEKGRRTAENIYERHTVLSDAPYRRGRKDRDGRCLPCGTLHQRDHVPGDQGCAGAQRIQVVQKTASGSRIWEPLLFMLF